MSQEITITICASQIGAYVLRGCLSGHIENIEVAIRKTRTKSKKADLERVKRELQNALDAVDAAMNCVVLS